jgi:hypothetical protein
MAIDCEGVELIELSLHCFVSLGLPQSTLERSVALVAC